MSDVGRKVFGGKHDFLPQRGESGSGKCAVAMCQAAPTNTVGWETSQIEFCGEHYTDWLAGNLTGSLAIGGYRRID